MTKPKWMELKQEHVKEFAKMIKRSVGKRGKDETKTYSTLDKKSIEKEVEEWAKKIESKEKEISSLSNDDILKDSYGHWMAQSFPNLDTGYENLSLDTGEVIIPISTKILNLTTQEEKNMNNHEKTIGRVALERLLNNERIYDETGVGYQLSEHVNHPFLYVCVDQHNIVQDDAEFANPLALHEVFKKHWYVEKEMSEHLKAVVEQFKKSEKLAKAMTEQGLLYDHVVIGDEDHKEFFDHLNNLTVEEKAEFTKILEDSNYRVPFKVNYSVKRFHGMKIAGQDKLFTEKDLEQRG
ncbi:hypothetical protein EXIGUO8H_20349 [Exiguobacterium sp. 8H]|uniref:hypothetical protein n=1 Tax=unclassified Exiguobacterium TaxID=2644629 RepID=UPI0012F05D72|nr:MULTISPECIES: hypothetical protein [unclassified Exiguobacterium]VXB52157.1 hypothetical protein EXIGUO8A_11417 [Exiguobacterium sp. 8A]VXB52885.1 hypothetical protein EXIGUO8H_20349 [Exiguobacterium sp. 8H]